MLLNEQNADFTNFGFDHVALATTDREACRRFFQDGLKMKCVRNDEHLLVLTTGVNALFFFKAEPGQPLSDGLPSRVHHVGFVVDNLYARLKATCPEYTSVPSNFRSTARLSWAVYAS